MTALRDWLRYLRRRARAETMPKAKPVGLSRATKIKLLTISNGWV